MKKERNKIIPSGYLVPYKNGKILLSRRFQTGYMDGYYSLAAGHGEPNESFAECTIREAREEIGIVVNKKDLQIIHTMHRIQEDERVDVFFICKKWKGTIKNMEQDKCDDLSWFSVKKLPKNIVPYVKQALIEGLINKNLYSDWNDSKKKSRS